MDLAEQQNKTVQIKDRLVPCYLFRVSSAFFSSRPTITLKHGNETALNVESHSN